MSRWHVLNAWVDKFESDDPPETEEQSWHRFKVATGAPDEGEIGMLAVRAARTFLPAAREAMPGTPDAELLLFLATTWLVGVESGVSAAEGLYPVRPGEEDPP